MHMLSVLLSKQTWASAASVTRDLNLDVAEKQVEG